MSKVTTRQPLLRKFFEECKIDPVILSHNSGVIPLTIQNWRRGLNTPRLDLLTAVVNAGGYDIVLVKRGEANEEK